MRKCLETGSWIPACAGMTAWGGPVLATLTVLCTLAGCAVNFGRGGSKPSQAEAVFAEADLYSHESRTLSGLATLESAVNDYIRDQKRIPNRLDDLVPQYLAEIPIVEIGRPDLHRDTNKAQYYLGRIIENGMIDGTQLKDTGRWGYAHNDHQVIVFVDCVHEDSRGKPWYKERGAF